MDDVHTPAHIAVSPADNLRPATADDTRPLVYLPVSLFGSVMGLSGLSVAWKLAGVHFGLPAAISTGLAVTAFLAFIAVALAYLVKAFAAPDAVRAEFRHPIAGNLFGTPLISLLLLPIVIAPVSLMAARAMWMVGALAMLGFAWTIIDRWMSDRQQIAHATPAWMVPVVGLLDVPLALPVLDMPALHGMMVACLAIGLFFAIPLFTMVFSRLLFEPPLPDALLPISIQQCLVTSGDATMANQLNPSGGLPAGRREAPRFTHDRSTEIPFEMLAVKIAIAVRMSGIGRSKFYELIKEGRIETIKVGTATLVPVADLRAFLDSHRRKPTSPET